MKVMSVAEPVVRIGMGQEHGFKIRATAKAFKILSSGLYKDKIAAIIREVSTNAWDAHVASKITHRPIAVHLPNILEPFFSVRDYGTGLSHENMITIYTTYFESTKADDNDENGGFGLGSKSPLSYTQSFTVISRHGGRKMTYDVFLDDDEMPAIALRQDIEMETGEENGLEVIVPVTERYDIASFIERARKIYMYYPTKPVVSGVPNFEPTKREPLIQGDGYRLYKTAHYERAQAIMGVVAYPIDEKSLGAAQAKLLGKAPQSPPTDTWMRPVSSTTATFSKILALNIEIDFEIGDLDIQAGREELSYDAKTSQKIAERITAIQQHLTAQVQKRFSTCSNLREAMLMYYEMFLKDHTLSFLRPVITPTFNGQSISNSAIELSTKTFQNLTVDVFDYGGRETVSRTTIRMVTEIKKTMPDGATVLVRAKQHPSVNIGCDEETVLINDRPTYWVSRVRQWMDNNEIERVCALDCDDAEELEKVKAKLDGFKFVLVSELPKPETAEIERTTTTVKKFKNALRHNIIRGTYDDVMWPAATINTDEGGIYLLTRHNQLCLVPEAANPASTESVSAIISTAFLLGLLDPEKDTIYAVPATLSNFIKKNDAWVSLLDVIATRLKERYGSNEEIAVKIAQAKSWKVFKTHYLYWGHETIRGELPETHDVRKFIDEYIAQRGLQNVMDIPDNFLQYLGITNMPDHKDRELKPWWARILKKYPFLRLIERNFSEIAVTALQQAEYIKQVDAWEKMNKKATKQA